MQCTMWSGLFSVPLCRVATSMATRATFPRVMFSLAVDPHLLGPTALGHMDLSKSTALNHLEVSIILYCCSAPITDTPLVPVCVH